MRTPPAALLSKTRRSRKGKTGEGGSSGVPRTSTIPGSTRKGRRSNTAAGNSHSRDGNATPVAVANYRAHLVEIKRKPVRGVVPPANACAVALPARANQQMARAHTAKRVGHAILRQCSSLWGKADWDGKRGGTFCRPEVRFGFLQMAGERWPPMRGRPAEALNQQIHHILRK